MLTALPCSDEMDTSDGGVGCRGQVLLIDLVDLILEEQCDVKQVPNTLQPPMPLSVCVVSFLPLYSRCCHALWFCYAAAYAAACNVDFCWSAQAFENVQPGLYDAVISGKVRDTTYFQNFKGKLGVEPVSGSCLHLFLVYGVLCNHESGFEWRIWMGRKRKSSCLCN